MMTSRDFAIYLPHLWANNVSNARNIYRLLYVHTTEALASYFGRRPASPVFVDWVASRPRNQLADEV